MPKTRKTPTAVQKDKEDGILTADELCAKYAQKTSSGLSRQEHDTVVKAIEKFKQHLQNGGNVNDSIVVSNNHSEYSQDMIKYLASLGYTIEFTHRELIDGSKINYVDMYMTKHADNMKRA